MTKQNTQPRFYEVLKGKAKLNVFRVMFLNVYYLKPQVVTYLNSLQKLWWGASNLQHEQVIEQTYECLEISS